MRKTTGDVIYPTSLVALLTLSVVELELFTMGAEIIKTAGRDAWLSILLAAPLSYFFLYITVRLAQRFTGRTILEYAPRLWGSFFARALFFIFILYELLWLVRILWRSADINTIYFLHKTPLFVIMLFFMVGAILLIRYGLTPLVRFFEFTLPFFLIFMFISLVIALSNIKPSYFIPVLANGIWPVLKGAFLYLSMFQGLEILLFAVPFTINPGKALFPAVIGLSLIHITSLLVLISILGNLGYAATLNLLYPGAEMLNTLNVPGWPVERFELFLTLPWLLAVFTSMGVALYLACYAILRLVRLKKPGAVYWTVGLLVIPATYLIPNILWAIALEWPLRLLTLLVVYLLPLFTYGLAELQRRKGDESV